MLTNNSPIYTASSSPVAEGYNGNQLTEPSETSPPPGFCLNIDYLIINLTGQFKLSEEEPIKQINGFEIRLENFGTKIFKYRYSITYEGLSLGTLLTTPRSEVIDENLIQFQYENSLFYLYTGRWLDAITRKLCKTINSTFKSINRLDIALDKENKNNYYQRLISGVLNEKCRIAGKDKKIAPYYETSKGTPFLTGFAIGKRTASRFLRVYNKSLELEKHPKEYIVNRWKENGLSSNVWRYEYQLNATFFRYLQDHEQTNITYQVFDRGALVNLIEKAEKNHFEIKTNTGKSQINKEQTIIVHCWDTIRNLLSTVKTDIQRVYKILEPSLLSQKRLIKATFREYWQSKQTDISHILSLNSTFENYPLRGWFNTKLDQYLQEFQRKAVEVFSFDRQQFEEHSTLLV